MYYLLYKMMENDNVKVAKSKVAGWGVFAKKKFAPGELIDVSISLVKPNEEWSTATEDYIFSRGNYSAFALGNGGIFNHSNSPNARHELTARLKELHVFAVKHIAPGEEILISYGKNYFKTRPSLKQAENK